MNAYTYEVRGTSVQIIEVHAEDTEQAEAKIRDAWLNGEPLASKGYKLLTIVKEQ
jgi:hypothetical protein